MLRGPDPGLTPGLAIAREEEGDISVLEQPGIVNSIGLNLLPGLCTVDGKCSPSKIDSKIVELTQQQGYCIRLLDLNGRSIATLGSIKHQFIDKMPTMHWKTITDDRGERYHIHTLGLKTIDNRDWGYLQVAQSFHQLDEYMNSLHLILIFGIPLLMLLITGVSWWLSGLAMQPIYQSYQQIQQFTADAAHELRTPLSVERIAVDSALDPEIIESETRNNLEIIHRQVKHLSRLAEDLLWLSRLEAKQLPAQSQPCCLNDLVSDLEEELAPLAIAAQIDLNLEILVDRQIYINGDSDRLYRSIANLTAFGKNVVAQVREMTGFDRVLLYQFDDDGHGAVIAEDKAAQMESYLGLHFPASDIPLPAREMFLANQIRVIPDTREQAVEMIPAQHPLTNRPTDLTLANLRSAAPCHTEYLQNMGVGASLTISLLKDGQLRGIVACHHQTPKSVALIWNCTHGRKVQTN